MTPPLVGVVPFGLVTGVVSTAAGLTPLETMVMAVATFSGIVHIVSAQLYAAGAPLVVIVATVAVLSLRLVIYSAGPDNPRLIAALVAIGVARLTRSMLWTNVAGMLALWVAQWGLA